MGFEAAGVSREFCRSSRPRGDGSVRLMSRSSGGPSSSRSLSATPLACLDTRNWAHPLDLSTSKRLSPIRIGNDFAGHR